MFRGTQCSCLQSADRREELPVNNGPGGGPSISSAKTDQGRQKHSKAQQARLTITPSHPTTAQGRRGPVAFEPAHPSAAPLHSDILEPMSPITIQAERGGGLVKKRVDVSLIPHSTYRLA